MIVEFSKYQGTGNDFIVIDDRNNRFPENHHSAIAALCNRKFGIGADGLILLRASDDYDFEMVYFNSDGHQSSMCGNGGRCILSFAHQLGVFNEHASFNAIDGIHEGSVDQKGYITLGMNKVTNWKQEEDHIILDTGSPHYVKKIHDNPFDKTDFVINAAEIRNSPPFRKQGINVNFIQVQEQFPLLIRTFERGVENETLSCGTGAVAAAISKHLFQGGPKGKFETELHTAGGALRVEFEYADSIGYQQVKLIGPAEEVFQGTFELARFESK